MKKPLMALTAAFMAASMDMTDYTATAQDITNKNHTSYTAGTHSVYGPSLDQAQLNSVAQATADFINNNIIEGMSTDDNKIKAAHETTKYRKTLFFKVSGNQ